jgi:hypothetical protein
MDACGVQSNTVRIIYKEICIAVKSNLKENYV